MDFSDPTIRKNKESLEKRFHDDFHEIGRSGQIFTKSEIIEALLSEEPFAFAVIGMECKQVSDELILVLYDTEFEGRYAHRTSVWVQVGKDWQIIHHQGTPFTP
jgi:hypothetical protein